MAHDINVNGTVHTVDAENEMPLLWVLRDRLGLTGTKYGCGLGLCGACTVMLDGQPIRSCLTPISTAAGKEIKTIESLEDSHPDLIKTWVQNNVAQCGYCQSGQLMSAAALLDKQKNPSDQDIDSAMSGNICRCGTYNRIRAAIHEAAEARS